MYDSAGTLLWVNLRGDDSAVTEGYGVATDSLNRAIVVGKTDGLIAQASAGKPDIYIIVYDSSGSVDWDDQVLILYSHKRKYQPKFITLLSQRFKEH